MRLLVTGGTGVLGQAFIPLARAEGHQVDAPGRAGLDLFDPAAVAAAVSGADAVLHLATRIPSLARLDEPQVWRENDRLRAEASAIMADAALAADVKTFVQPTVTFVYPDGPVTEETPVRAVGLPGACPARPGTGARRPGRARAGLPVAGTARGRAHRRPGLGRFRAHLPG